MRLHPILPLAFAVIARIQPDMGAAGTLHRDVFRRPEQGHPMAIHHVGGMALHREPKALGIHEQVPLPPLELCRTVVAPLSTDPRRLDTLAVNEAYTRLGLAPQNDSQPFT
jgi:hypothetical protein